MISVIELLLAFTHASQIVTNGRFEAAARAGASSHDAGSPRAPQASVIHAWHEKDAWQRRSANRPEQLRAELKESRKQRDNFLALVADGKALPSILQRIAELGTTIAAKEPHWKSSRSRHRTTPR
jgi:hypothetical protein